MSKVNRREFIGGLAALGAAGVGGCKLPGYCGLGESVYGGIPLGVITFSYWHMWVGYLCCLKYVKDSGLSTVALMGYDLGVDAGAPIWKLPWDQTTDEQAERAAWRAKVEPEKLFADVRALYADHGVDIHILKPECNLDGRDAQTDEEIEYWFKAAKALGATAMTRELPNLKNPAAVEKGLRRLAKFCDRYDIDIAFHNHTQLNATTYDGPLFDWSERFKINFDIAHYVAANEDDPLDFIRKYHDRLASIHVKDRTTKAHKARTTPFGEGDTPLKEMFALLQKENWIVPCDIEMEYIIPVGSDAVGEVCRARRYCRSVIEG